VKEQQRGPATKTPRWILKAEEVLYAVGQDADSPHRKMNAMCVEWRQDQWQTQQNAAKQSPPGNVNRSNRNARGTPATAHNSTVPIESPRLLTIASITNSLRKYFAIIRKRPTPIPLKRADRYREVWIDNSIDENYDRK
jgi:hypothetical protein